MTSRRTSRFAGSCGSTAGWALQPAIRGDAWVADVALSAKPFTGKADLPYDEAVRTGTFVRGVRFVNVRVEVRNLAAAARRAAFDHASGRQRRLRGRALGVGCSRRLGEAATEAEPCPARPLGADVRARRLGRRRGAVRRRRDAEAGRQPAAERRRGGARARVAARRRGRRLPGRDVARDRGSGLRDRPTATAGRPAAGSSARSRAPRSDVIRNDAARPGGTLTCEVTPSDGRLRGPTASARATLPGEGGARPGPGSAGQRSFDASPGSVRAVVVAGVAGVPVLRLRDWVLAAGAPPASQPVRASRERHRRPDRREQDHSCERDEQRETTCLRCLFHGPPSVRVPTGSESRRGQDRVKTSVQRRVRPASARAARRDRLAAEHSSRARRGRR